MISGYEMIWDHKMPKERTIEFNAALWDSIQDSFDVRSARIAQSAPKQWYWTEMAKICKCKERLSRSILDFNPEYMYPSFK